MKIVGVLIILPKVNYPSSGLLPCTVKRQMQRPSLGQLRVGGLHALIGRLQVWVAARLAQQDTRDLRPIANLLGDPGICVVSRPQTNAFK